MTEEEIDKIRQDDIELFASRYAELFSGHFDKNTPQQKQEFYEEIKQELFTKCSKYVIDENNVIGTHAAADYALFESELAFLSQETRIHELVHHFNTRSNMLDGGLKDFFNGLVLKDFDEGSTQLITLKILKKGDVKYTDYNREVSMTRIIESVAGERDLIRATRFGPQILCNSIDEILKTNNLVQSIEKDSQEANNLSLKVENKRNFIENMQIRILKSQISHMPQFFEALKKSNNPQLIEQAKNVCQKFDYVNYKNMFNNNNVKTVADSQRKFLEGNIRLLERKKDINIYEKFRIELKKYLYDKIDFQSRFSDKQHGEYGFYELSNEEKEQAKQYESKLDAKNRNMEVSEGPMFFGNIITRLELGVYKPVNYNNIYVPIGIETKKDEYIAKHMNLAEEQECIENWYYYIYENFCKENNIEFDSETLPYDKTKENLLKNIENEINQLMNNYIHLDQETRMQKYEEKSLTVIHERKGLLGWVKEKISKIKERLFKNKIKERNIQIGNDSAKESFKSELTGNGKFNQNSELNIKGLKEYLDKNEKTDIEEKKEEK